MTREQIRPFLNRQVALYYGADGEVATGVLSQSAGAPESASYLIASADGESNVTVAADDIVRIDA